MWIPPLLVIPLIIYNLVAFDVVGDRANGWASPVFSLDMASGAIWTLSVGDLLVVLALALLLFEIARAARNASSTLVGRSGSAVVLLIYLAEFVLVPAAATSLFFTCMLMSLVDTVARFLAPKNPRAPKISTQ
ncbi:MAG: hypothetical protein GXP01_00260 [Alphaproteobacteria bacterium]|nr:hypothetical protein [Alphaproteobacteria bacterium]